jgi:hypothetical protein
MGRFVSFVLILFARCQFTDLKMAKRNKIKMIRNKYFIKFHVEDSFTEKFKVVENGTKNYKRIVR